MTAPQIPAEDDLPPDSPLLQVDLQKRAAEDMPRVPEGDGDPLANRNLPPVRVLPKEAQDFIDVLRRVEGLAELAPVTLRVLVDELGIHLLNVGAVVKHDPAEVGRCRGRVDGAAESPLRQGGQVSGVVDVGVRENDRA